MAIMNWLDEAEPIRCRHRPRVAARRGGRRRRHLYGTTLDLPDRHPPISGRPQRGHGLPPRPYRLRIALHPLPDGGAAGLPRGLDPSGMRAERPLRASRTHSRHVGSEAADCGGQAAQACLFGKVRTAVEHARDDIAPRRPGRNMAFPRSFTRSATRSTRTRWTRSTKR